LRPRLPTGRLVPGRRTRLHLKSLGWRRADLTETGPRFRASAGATEA
jgi:hypothetical protein